MYNKIKYIFLYKIEKVKFLINGDMLKCKIKKNKKNEFEMIK